MSGAQEKRAFSDYLNSELYGDNDLGSSLPLDSASDDLYKVVAQGKLLSKFVRKISPQKHSSLALSNASVIDAAKALELPNISITENELNKALENQSKVLEFIWQLIYFNLSKINPESDLHRILQPGETVTSLPFETVLIRWFNFHLKNHGHHREISNFTKDIKDCENYAVLVHQLAKETLTSKDLADVFREKDLFVRTEKVLSCAARLGCRKFVTTQDIIQPNERLNIGFLATLFKRYPDIGPTAEEIAAELFNRIEEAEGLFAESILDREDLESQIGQVQLDFSTLNLELADLQLDFEDVLSECTRGMNEKTSLEELLSVANAEKTLLSDEATRAQQEIDDLFAQLEQEISFKVDLDTLLKETNEEFDCVSKSAQSDQDALQTELDEEHSLVENVTEQLDVAQTDLEETKCELSILETNLEIALQEHMQKTAQTRSEVDVMALSLQETLQLADEVEKSKDELFKLLTDTINELERAKNHSQSREEELKQIHAQEVARKQEAHQLLTTTVSSHESAMAEWKQERAKLLARIDELETEIDELRDEMDAQLAAIHQAKTDALAKALADRTRALEEAEREKLMELNKVRMLLTGNAKQGYLWFETDTLVGMQWKKRYFVLRDNLLAWYHKEKHVTTQKPKGALYCDETRIYELSSEECKREFAFQLDTGKARTNVAAESLEDMKSWMNEIRVAKKKKMGVKVVSETKKEKDSDQTACNKSK